MTAPTNQEFVSGTTITSQWLNGVNDSINNITSNIPGSTSRTSIERAADSVCVADFPDVQTAVTYAKNNNKQLYWDKIYTVTSTIIDLHEVTHKGSGGVTRGVDTFYVEPSTQTNIIYVTSTGYDDNDGLTADTAKLTIQSAIEALANYQGALLGGGVWRISIGAGTFARGRFPDDGLRSKYPIQIIGVDIGGHPNVPTTLIKEGATQAAFGLLAQRSTNLYVKDIKFEDFNGSTSSAGISVSNRCNIETVNCHFEDCYIGLSATEWCEIDVKGGVFNDCGYRNSVTGGGYGIRGLFHCKFSVGTQNAATLTLGPLFTNNYIGVFGQELTTGHIDWCTFTSNNAGIRLTVASRTNCDGSAFTGNITAAWATDNSVISASVNTTFSGNTQNLIVGGGSTTSTSPVMTSYSSSYGRTEYVVYGSKEPQTVNTTSSTVVATDTIKAGMLSETYGSSIPPKKIGFRMFGTLTGTADIKRIQLRLGAAALAPVTFLATETGAFHVQGELVFRAPSSQVAEITGWRFTGTGSRVSVASATDALSTDTVVNVEAVVGNASDSIVIEYVELFYSGI